MSEQTYDKCQSFDNRSLCPYRNEILMKQFIEDISIGEGYKKTITFDNEEKINDKFCHNCKSFRPF